MEQSGTTAAGGSGDDVRGLLPEHATSAREDGAGARLRGGMRSMEDGMRGGVDQLARYAREHPVGAVVAAMGVGFLLARTGVGGMAPGAAARGMLATARSRDVAKLRPGARDSDVMVAKGGTARNGPYFKGASMTGHGVGLP